MKPYRKSLEYSYSIGAFVTIELIEKRSEYVAEIFLSSNVDEELKVKIVDLCERKKIKYSYNNKLIRKISGKENVFVLGRFNKYKNKLTNSNHIVLDNPANFGNIGTIMRSAIAFNITNIAFIGNFADYFNPKVVRASMGSIFHLNINSYSTIEEYIADNKEHNLYSFMLDGKTLLSENNKLKKPYSLIFGNEASGLDSSYHNISSSIKIDSTDKVDSLNITSAVSIALYSAFVSS